MTTKEALKEYAQEVRRQALRVVAYLSEEEIWKLSSIAEQCTRSAEAMAADVEEDKSL